MLAGINFFELFPFQNFLGVNSFFTIRKEEEMHAGWDKSICIIFFSEFPLDKFLSLNQERGGVDACWLG